MTDQQVSFGHVPNDFDKKLLYYLNLWTQLNEKLYAITTYQCAITNARIIEF